MKKLLTILVASLLGCTATVNAQVSNDNQEGVYKIDKHAQRFRDGEIIVKFKTGASAAKSVNGTIGVSPLSKALSAIGASSAEKLMPLSGGKNVGAKAKAYNGTTVVSEDMNDIYRMEYDTAKVQSVQQAIDAVKAIDGVEYAEPNYIIYALDNGEPAATSCWDDPLCNNQWGLDALHLPGMHGKTHVKTKRTVIAILDTGVDITHPDLVDNIWTNEAEATGAKNSDDDGNGFKDDIHGWDFVNQTANVRDNNGHGTHCAGIAAAVSGNSIGVVGADPEAYIMPVTVMQSDGTGDIATIIKGLDYASANGADIISMSLGSYSTSTAFEQALGKAYATSVLVAAAGNDGHTIETSTHCNSCAAGGTPCYPAAYSFVLGVESSSDAAGTLASYSNYDNTGHIYSGWGESKLYNYELRAPGSNIMSTYLGGKYKALNGTSMACPFAAGAISVLLRDRDYASKEILFGDLIHASGDGNLNILAAYNITDADRQPSLELVTYTIDDSKTISDANDGDGRLDAGETVDIYPVIRNSWGQAKNIKCSIALATNEDPTIISVIKNNVDFGSELSSYAKATATNPLRIKVSDNCADGRHICLVIGATCSNISSDLAQDVTLTAENGVELGGMLAENTTLKAGVQYIVTSTLGVPSGVTLTIEPGTTIKFKDNTGFSCSGNLVAKGTPNNLIEFTKADLSNGSITHFIHNSTIEYVKIHGLREVNSGIGEYTFRSGTYKNCIIDDVNSNDYLLADATFEDCNIYNCYASTGLHTGGALKSCNIINNRQSSSYIHYLPRYSLTQGCNVFYNQSYYGYSDTGSDSSTPVVITTTTPSYWGSSVESIVRERILDMNHPTKAQGFGYIDLSNMLTEPSAAAHGIVWKVLVDGTDPQDEADDMSPLGVGKHRFDVYFNRAMNTAVAPTISMGVRSPYTQVAIAENGKWSTDAKKYTAYLTITGKTNSDGENTIYVYGAQDDEYFEIPEEKYRFNVNVQAAGSMATGLMATEGLGKVTLDWETTETNFDDLLGFNVYRGTSADACTTKVNTELIEPGTVDNGKMEQSFVDYNVTPGKTYYYIVKEMSTDLSQNAVSNAVACTPKTAEKGDANGSMTVDVMDVVSEISYMSGGNPQPFVFDAADVNSDTKVNILDVVGTVNIVKSKAAGNAKAAAADGSDGVARFTIEDGILYVDCDQPLGGLQFMVNAPQGTEMTAMEGVDGMEHSATWMNDNQCLYIAFSMAGNVIPSGKNAILKIGMDSTGSPTMFDNMIISSTDGKNIVAINGSATSIDNLPYGIENSGNVVSRVYDITGRQVNAKSLKSGVYIMNISVDGKVVKSYKFLQK